MTYPVEPEVNNPKSRLPMASLPFNLEATIVSLGSKDSSQTDPKMLMRLAELGFLPGEKVSIVRRGPGGLEPIAVQVGDTMFALRAIEAECVQVELSAAGSVKS